MARTPTQEPESEYSPEEAQHRFEAALRGSQKAGHVPMKSMASKISKLQKKARKEKG
jgi:hypothetical protein